VCFAAAVALVADPSSLQFDHLWIVVSPNAPERGAGTCGLPDITRCQSPRWPRHGVDFQSSSRMPTLSSCGPIRPSRSNRALSGQRKNFISACSGAAADGARSEWAFGRPRRPPRIPFPHLVDTSGMVAGSDIVILTARDDTHSRSLFVTPRARADPEKQAKLAARSHHPLGIRQITAIRLFFPRDSSANSATRLSTETGPF